MPNRSKPTMTPATLEVLVALAGTPRHGYSLMQEVERSTSGAVRLGAGTLYTLLKRLLGAAWIREVEAPAGADPRRRYYECTPAGRLAARQELERIRSLLASPAAVQLLGSGP